MNSENATIAAPSATHCYTSLPFPMLKPFAFRSKGKWSDGFDQHGVFEIVEVHDMDSDRPWALIRRVATARADCPIDETHKFWLSYLAEFVERVEWSTFLPSEGGRI